jgi:hypothetical protein
VSLKLLVEVDTQKRAAVGTNTGRLIVNFSKNAFSVRCEVLTAVSLNMVVFWVVAPCILVEYNPEDSHPQRFFSFIGYVTSNVKMIMNDEQEIICMELVVACFNVLYSVLGHIKFHHRRVL